MTAGPQNFGARPQYCGLAPPWPHMGRTTCRPRGASGRASAILRVTDWGDILSSVPVLLLVAVTGSATELHWCSRMASTGETAGRVEVWASFGLAGARTAAQGA